jgi:hypothetical protein
MYFGGSSPACNRALFSAAGLRVVDEDVVTLAEPEEGDVVFHWLLSRNG